MSKEIDNESISATVLYVTSYSHYILIHGYHYNTSIKRAGLGYSNWHAGELGYIKGNIKLAVPISKIIEAIVTTGDDITKTITDFVTNNSIKNYTVLSNISSIDKNVIPYRRLTSELVDPGTERLLLLGEYTKHHNSGLAYKEYDVKGFFSSKDSRPLLLMGSKSIITSKTLLSYGDNVIHSINISDNIDLGRRNSSVSYVVTELNEKLPALDEIINKRKESPRYNTGIYNIHINALYSPRDTAIKDTFKDKAIVVAHNEPIVLSLLNGTTVLEDVYPPNLVSKAISDFLVLRKTMERFKISYGSNIKTVDGLVFEDITDVFYDNNVLHKKYDKVNKIVVPIELGNTIKIPICLGEDLPNRNTLVKLGKDNTKVYLCVECIGRSYSYNIIIKTDNGISVWKNFYASTILDINET